jgi:hypothetical protein
MQHTDDTNRPPSYADLKRNPEERDSMGLTPGQRTFAWVALVAGIIALMITMMRTPDRMDDGPMDDRPNADEGIH